MHLDPWTFALQTINVLVLAWLLARFLFRPVSAIIAARRKAAEMLLADAEAVRAKVAAEAAIVAQQRDGLADDGDRIVATARASAEAERTAVLHQAQQAVASYRAEAQQAIERDRQAMRELLEHQAADLAVVIATRLLGRVPPKFVNRAFLEGLAGILALHPAVALLNNATIEVRSAAPLDAASQSECRDMLTRVLGSTPELSFRTDPTLVAGIELASPHAELRNSWRADLEQITHALQHDVSHVAASSHLA